MVIKTKDLTISRAINTTEGKILLAESIVILAGKDPKTLPVDEVVTLDFSFLKLNLLDDME